MGVCQGAGVELSAFQLLTYDDEHTVGVRDSGVGSSLGPHSSRRWRDLEAGAVPRDQGTFRLPGE